MKNKKGQLLAGLSAGVIAIIVVGIILIVAGILIFTSVNKFAIIGGGVIALTLIFGFKGEFNKSKGIFMLVLVGVGLIFIFASSSLQSILSVSQVNVGSDGKVYWVTTAVANKDGDFFIFTPSRYLFQDGSGKTVTPTQRLELTVSRLQSQCSYLPILQTKKIYALFIPIGEIKYYLLSNPEKIAKVSFTDSNGKSVNLDGTVVQSVQIIDSDGKGKVTIETQGLLGGKYNCPSQSNVVIIVDSNGDLLYRYQNQWESSISSLSGLSGLSLFNVYSRVRNLALNTQFTSTFSSTPRLESQKLIGDINFGNVVYTITADQDYFESVVYTPPKPASPEIVSVNFPQEIVQDASSSMTVSIRNKNDQTATSVVKVSSSKYGILPTSINVDISLIPKSVAFNIKAPSSIGSGDINIEICGISQFTSVSCVSRIISITTISSDTEPIIKCGDGICQSSETVNTCPADCRIVVKDEDKIACEQKALEQPLLGYEWVETSTSSCGWNPLCLVGITQPKVTVSGECKAQFLPYWLISGVVLVLGVVGIVALKMKKKGKRRRKK